MTTLIYKVLILQGYFLMVKGFKTTHIYALRAPLTFAHTENLQISSERYLAKVVYVLPAYFPEHRNFLCPQGFFNISLLHLRRYFQQQSL